MPWYARRAPSREKNQAKQESATLLFEKSRTAIHAAVPVNRLPRFRFFGRSSPPRTHCHHCPVVKNARDGKCWYNEDGVELQMP